MLRGQDDAVLIWKPMIRLKSESNADTETDGRHEWNCIQRVRAMYWRIGEAKSRAESPELSGVRRVESQMGWVRLV